ncbi:Kirola [Sesamum angolense]|uniref:Kirola n=1 Tax=Sesamum angolense TaxID=2727404 RepID=A0AAE1WV96_9LAMI|nr:Kirola [Sesamum angolense]
MALNGNLIAAQHKFRREISSSSCLDVQLSDMTKICPQIVSHVDLGWAQWATVGCVFNSNYTLGGEKRFSKTKIEAIDERKRSITYKVVEGCVLETYSSLKATFAIESDGQHTVVKWSIEYEKRSACTPQPHALLALFTSLTKLLELRCSLVAN